MGVQDDYNEAFDDGVRSVKTAKSEAIALLEDKLAELRAQNGALQAHNNQLLDRARKAEWSLDALKCKHKL